MGNMQVINLLYTMDDNFVMQAAVSMVSLFENNPDICFHLYIISDEIGGLKQKRLIGIAKEYGHTIDIIDMPDLDAIAGVKLDANGLARAAYCRLFLPQLLPDEVNTVFYLDPDTLVTGKISELANILTSEEFEGYYLAACLDSKADYKRFNGFKRKEKYYNSGVLLINLKRWRETGIQGIFCHEIRRRKGRSIELDQSYINCVMIGRIMTLPARYNVMYLYYNSYDDYLKKSGYRPDEIYTKDELSEAVQNPVIIHFAGEAKYRPWYRDCGHPMKEEWFEVYRKTGWEDFVPGRCDLKPPLSFFTACRIRMVKKLLQSRYAAMLYTKYKFGFDVKPFRNKTV